MSKMKTHKGAAKRFRKTAGGYKVRSANRGHYLTSRSQKRKRQLRTNPGLLDGVHSKTLDRMLVN